MVNSCIRPIPGIIQDEWFLKSRNHTVRWHTCTHLLIQMWIWNLIRSSSFTVVATGWRTSSRKAKTASILLLSAVIPKWWMPTGCSFTCLLTTYSIILKKEIERIHLRSSLNIIYLSPITMISYQRKIPSATYCKQTPKGMV